MTTTLDPSVFTRAGEGVTRPEDVAVAPDTPARPVRRVR